MSRYIDADVRVGVPLKEAVIIEKTELTDDCINKIADAVVRKLADRKTEPQTEYRRVGQAIDSVTGKVLGETYDVPQTDCSWK